VKTIKTNAGFTKEMLAFEKTFGRYIEALVSFDEIRALTERDVGHYHRVRRGRYRQARRLANVLKDRFGLDLTVPEGRV